MQADLSQLGSIGAGFVGEPGTLVLVGRYGLSTSWPDLFRPSPQHGAAMDGRNKSGHDDVATRWAKMRIAARRHPVDAVLTLHGIEAGTLAFIAFVPAERAPATRRGTAPPGQPPRRPMDAVLTLHGIEAGTFAFIAFV